MASSQYRLNALFKAIVVFAGIGLFVSGCLDRMVTRPTVTVQEVRISELTLSGATLTFRVQLENPNGFGITVTAFSYTIYLNDRPVASGQAPEPISINRHSVTEFSLPLKTSFAEIENQLKSILHSDTLAYRIEGSLVVQSVFGRLTFPYTRTGTIGPTHTGLIGLPSAKAAWNAHPITLG